MVHCKGNPARNDFLRLDLYAINCIVIQHFSLVNSGMTTHMWIVSSQYNCHLLSNRTS